MTPSQQGRNSAKLLRLVLAAALALTVASAAAAAQARDPLTPAEGDQLRDTATQLDKRIGLLVQFAGARLTKFEQIRTASPRPPGRDPQLYELLRQYAAILPEMDDAADDLTQQPKQYKVAKVLDNAIVEIQKMDATLRHIQTDSSPADLANYHFELDNCLDVTSDSLQNAQQDRAQAGKS